MANGLNLKVVHLYIKILRNKKDGLLSAVFFLSTLTTKIGGGLNFGAGAILLTLLRERVKVLVMKHKLKKEQKRK